MGDVEKLIKKLSSKNADVRQTAAMELGEFGNFKAVEPLINTLKDDNEDVRIWAAVSLGKIGDEKALEPLMEAVMHDSDRVKREAAGAVVKIAPSFNDVNIDEIIRKVIVTYQEYTQEKVHEQESIAEQKKPELETPEIKEPEPEIQPQPEIVPEQEVEPELAINEFISALKEAPLDDRVEEISNVLAHVMNLFVNAIDDISAHIQNMEVQIEQRFQNIEKQIGGVPAIFPSESKAHSKDTGLLGEKPFSPLSARAALNEELKRTLRKRKIED